MTKILEIEQCDDCPHCERGIPGGYCKKFYPKKETPLYNVIPSWCPLPDSTPPSDKQEQICSIVGQFTHYEDPPSGRIRVANLTEEQCTTITDQILKLMGK